MIVKYTYIITNHHVIDGANKVQVVFSNNEYVDAEVVGSDEYSDVAILRCQPSFDVSVIDLGDSDLLDKGETVLPTQQMALILSVIISFLLFYAGCLSCVVTYF